MRDLSEKLRGAKQTRAGNTSPKEKSLTAYLTEKTVRHNNKMIIQNNTYTARRAMLWRDSLPG